MNQDNRFDEVDDLEPQSSHTNVFAGRLIRAMFEQAVGTSGLAEIAERKAFCLVVTVPGISWAEPVDQFVEGLGEWGHSILRTRTPSRGHTPFSSTPIDVLAQGGRVFAVTVSPEYLSDAVIAATDQMIVLRPPSPDLLAGVIAEITGSTPMDIPARLGIGLGFAEIAACIRKDTTAAECIARLETASTRKGANAPVASDVPPIETLCGYGAAKSWALDLIADLDGVRRGDLRMRDLQARIVLAGPPGTGKTTFARSLSRSTGLPLVATSVASWFISSSGHLDAVIKQMDEVFTSANALGEAIVLLDEADAIPNRATLGRRNTDYWTPVVAHLLTLLDGACAETSNLVVIGATNHADRLDAALVRPGRLSRIVTIDPPDEADLEGILRQHLGGDLVDEDLGSVAMLARGATGAMVVEWVKAARRAARVAGRPVIIGDLMDLVAPRDDRPQALVARIATHEAGHAIVAHALEVGTIGYVSILPNGPVGGVTSVDRQAQVATRADVERLVVQGLAGRAAEQVVFGDPGTGSGGSARSDLAAATRLLAVLHLGTGLGEELRFRGDADSALSILATDEKAAAAVEADLRRLYRQALDLVTANLDLVRMVADRLVAERHLGGAQFRDLVRAAGLSASDQPIGKQDPPESGRTSGKVRTGLRR